jgi:hypothetical protein
MAPVLLESLAATEESLVAGEVLVVLPELVKLPDSEESEALLLSLGELSTVTVTTVAPVVGGVREVEAARSERARRERLKGAASTQP